MNVFYKTKLVFCAPDLYDISHDELPDLDLRRRSRPDDAERLLPLNPVLQPAELPLLAPIVERRHQHHDHHGDQDGHALDPLRVFLFLFKAGSY